MYQIQKVMQLSALTLRCLQDHLPSYGGLMPFPMNYCQEASTILLHILKQQQIHDFQLMQGCDARGRYHFWLQSSQHIIDLTAHQFEQIHSPFLCIARKFYPLQENFTQTQTMSCDTQWSYLVQLQQRIHLLFYRDYFNPQHLNQRAE